MTSGPPVADSDSDFLKWVAATDRPFAVADDVLEKSSVKRKQTLKRLDRLVDEGFLHSKKVGRGKVFWLTEAGRERVDD